MSNIWVFLAVTIGLIAASAFFVAVEFALLAAKRHRLEDATGTSGGSAKTAPYFLRPTPTQARAHAWARRKQGCLAERDGQHVGVAALA